MYFCGDVLIDQRVKAKKAHIPITLNPSGAGTWGATTIGQGLGGSVEQPVAAGVGTVIPEYTYNAPSDSASASTFELGIADGQAKKLHGAFAIVQSSTGASNAAAYTIGFGKGATGTDTGTSAAVVNGVTSKKNVVVQFTLNGHIAAAAGTVVMDLYVFWE